MSPAARSFATQFSLLDLGPKAPEPRTAHPRPALVPDPPAVDPSPQRDEVARLRASLAGTAASKIMNATELIRSLENSRRDESIPTTLAPFDQLLGGGLPRGKMVELTGRRNTAGRFAIALSALAAATSMGEAAVLVDLGDHLDPRTAEEMGIDLRRLLWIRPKSAKQAVMAVEMIAATGFQLVVLDLGLAPIKGKRVPDAAWVRLARTAEAHGTALLISSPYPVTGTASEAVIATTRTRFHWIGRGRSPRLLAGATTELHLEKHRHRRPGESTILALSVAEAPVMQGRGPRAEGRGDAFASADRTHSSPLALGPRPSALHHQPSALGPRPSALASAMAEAI